ncbi:hypothetical protein DL98DRAFT_592955 [Cadophora sp. DSE1049]|nr:hypothetical protein DL98DRAFT_592955 [Cadophora sp. DSE1049]
MKPFTNLPFLLLGITCFFLATSVSAISSNIHSANTLRSHAQILTRQDDSSSSEPLVLLNDPANYPSFPPTDTPPSSTSTESSISFSVLGKALIQDLTCKDCSAQGDISIQGTSDGGSDGWSLVASTSGVSAHVEIEASLRPDAELGFSATVKEIELDSFKVGGLVVVTPRIVVEVYGGTGASVDVDVSWGFDVTVPEGASIVITSEDGRDLSASILGFNNTQITQVPFNANISNPEVVLGIGLRFNFLLAVSPISSLLPSIYAGVYMDLPGVAAQFSPVSDVNANCQNITSSETDASLQVAFPNLLYIQPLAYAGVGATLGVDVPGDGFEFSEVELDEELASVEFALPSQCLEWSVDAEGGGEFAGAAAETSSNGASSNVLISSEDKRLAWAVAVLVLVMSGFGMLL